MEKEFYRVMVDGNGRTFIVDDAGNKLPPETAIHISQSLSDTANEICYLYLMYRPEKDDYKIGISIEPDRRLGELNGIEPHELLHTYPMNAHGQNCAAEIEIKLHKIFKAVGQHVEGEYFKLDEHDLDLWTRAGTENDSPHIADYATTIFDAIETKPIPDYTSTITLKFCQIWYALDRDEKEFELEYWYLSLKYIRHHYCNNEDRIRDIDQVIKWARGALKYQFYSNT